MARQDRQDRLALYWNLTKAISADNPAKCALKTYFATKCQEVAEDQEQPEKLFDAMSMCTMCGSRWNETDFDMKLKPQRLKNRMKYWRLVERFDSSKETTTGSQVLSQKQKKRAKWLKKRLCNSLELTCKQCHHQSSIQMQKPRSRKFREQMLLEREKSRETTMIVETPEQQSMKKKRRKAKDKNAGLKIPINDQKKNKPSLLLANNKNNNNNMEGDKKCPEQRKTESSQDSVGLNVNNNNSWRDNKSRLKATVDNKSRLEANVDNKSGSQNTSRNKKTGKMKDNSTIATKPSEFNAKICKLNGKIPNAKICTLNGKISNGGDRKQPSFVKKTQQISKTQQRNNILQLAAMLKKNSGKSGFNGSVDHNRLQLLLK